MSAEGLIKTRWLRNDGPLPLLVKPSSDEIDPATWALANREWIETQLLEYGALLIRKFNVSSTVQFEQFIAAISGKLLDYTNRSTPRSHVSGKIYTSTEYPATEPIPLHNELSYAREWPMKIWFLCARTAKEGGETPIADSRAVFNRMDPSIRKRFSRKKIMYTRYYGHGIDLPWQTVFQSDSRVEVEAYCRRVGIHFDWTDKGHLRTRQVCQAVARHPRTGDMVWFNQAHLFHVSNLKPKVLESMLSLFKEEDLPRNAYYGDGTPIEPAALDEIRDIYEQEAAIFPWREGDVLMLDNMLTAHGRRPFVGPRNVLVGMAEPINGQNAREQR